MPALRILKSCLFLTIAICLASKTFAADKPNVILITIDTVRADRMGFLGSARGLTPNLDALAQRSAIFTRAYSQVPITNPSHATILTGTYPQFHRVNDFGVPLSADLPSLPETLQHAGYHTAAFIGAAVLDPRGSAPGFDRGFDYFDADFTGGRRAEAVVDAVLQYLKKPSPNPLFIWVHLYDPHAPYVSPEPFRTRYASAPYDGAIAYADFALGRLFAALRAQGLYENSAIAVMSDHGESLGAHGEARHAYFLYDETIHVPLLIKLPGESATQKRIECAVDLVDVAPTLLQIVGLAAPAAMQGEPLLPLISSNDAPQSLAHRRIYSETDYPYLAYGWSPLRALRSDQYLFIEAPRDELYDLAADPMAEHNLIATAPAVASTLKAALDSLRARTAMEAAPAQSVSTDQQAQQLQALGYIASLHPGEHPAMDHELRDPKDMIEVANRMSVAVEDMAQGNFADALPLLQYAVKNDPGNAMANRFLGEAYVRLQAYADAVAPLRKAIELGPDLFETHYQLGLALFSLQDWKAAITEFSAVITKSPTWPAGHYWLGSAFTRLQRFSEAEKELQSAIDLQPDNFPALMALGQVLLAERNPQSASVVFQKAIPLAPNMGEPHRYLATAYTALGRYEDAKRENADAARLDSAQHP